MSTYFRETMAASSKMDSHPFAAKRDRKVRQRLAFLHISKTRTNKFFIFRQIVYICLPFFDLRLLTTI
jgi:hypothetical protein